MRTSIVIPVYNAQDYISECIESALNQTYGKIEVIAVNDGSTDNSLEILKKYADKIKIVSKTNGGTASALNAGIKVMSGEWFKWLSADDVLYPNAIEELIRETTKLDSRNYILYSNYDIIDSGGNVIEQFIEPNYNTLEVFDRNVILLDHYIGNGSASLIHKSAFDRFGLFDEKIGFAEDYELWLRLCVLHNFKLHLVPKILAKYRVHQAQLSKEKMGKSLENGNRIRKIILSKLDPSKRKIYEESLKRYKRNKPLLVRSRHVIRDLILSLLPKSTSNKILETYFYFKSKNK